MGFPKVFERPVRATPEQAYDAVMAFLMRSGAKVRLQQRPTRIEARHGTAMAMADSAGAKKILHIDIRPDPVGAVVRVTMPLSSWHFDDGRMMEFQVERTWALFLEPLWWSFGYPPTHI